MNTSDLLARLKLFPAQPLTPQIQNNLQHLKEICDRSFTNQAVYGNRVLNQKMLLNQFIAQLLTPEVLLYLFSNEAHSKTYIYRNQEGSIALSEAIFNGFKEGFDRCSSLTQSTVQIIENIKKALKLIELHACTQSKKELELNT